MKSNAQSNLITPWEKNDQITTTYRECIDYYDVLAKSFPAIKSEPVYMTDSGQPLHQVIIDLDQDFDPDKARNCGKTILFLNNGIHPGEPEGIDATMMLARDLLSNESNKAKLKNLLIVIIPIYNIDGCLNRSSFSRANQNGPQAYGFRGNDKNLDLNRDFIKCDSRNAQSFNKIFTYWNPDMMIDNHTSNGADYQYVMTLITSQEDKLGPVLGEYTRKTINPALFKGMAQKQWDMIPYVNAEGPPDENGIEEFLETARFSSGYASLHHCVAFMPETHMLKSYPPRVKGTYDLMMVMIDFLKDHGKELTEIRKQEMNHFNKSPKVPVHWVEDKSKFDMLDFKGYEAERKISKVTGGERLYYNRDKPFTKKIPYYNRFVAQDTIAKPFAYIIPQAWKEVIDRLMWNHVHLEQLASDMPLNVEMYHIQSFKTTNGPYEGHYPHSETKVTSKIVERNFRAGDYLVYTDQAAARYIVETLEPIGADSYFNWNFFDGILNQKEYFSDYVFEDLAEKFLNENPAIQKELNEKKATDEKFRNDPPAILDWVYRKSPWYEPSHNVYPVARLLEATEIPTRR